MNPPPSGWPRISSAVFYQDSAAAIDWLCKAFGFLLRLKVVGQDGRIEHSQLTFGEGVVMVADAERKDRPGRELFASPRGLNGANTQSMAVYVDDVDAHCGTAQAAGAVIVTQPETNDYGPDHWADRTYEAIDLEGHHWWFMQRMRG